jgi:hypothetical protein
MAVRNMPMAVRSAALVSTAAVLVLCGPVSDAAVARARDGDVPDVAMVIAGGTGRTTVLRSGEPGFARLRQLLMPDLAGAERVPEAWAEGRYPPVDLTVVWALTGVGGYPQTDRPPGGDVAVERQDQLLLAADGTPWIRSDPAPDVEDDDIRWHRAPRSVLVDLERDEALTGLGGITGSGESATAAGRARDGVGRGGFRWAATGVALGLVVGAGGTLLTRRAAARRDAGPPREEPRQELIDL